MEKITLNPILRVEGEINLQKAYLTVLCYWQH